MKSAVLSVDKLYRYQLTREGLISSNTRRVCWIMLNPSTADADIDDPTIRKCMRFSSKWGYTEMVVVNLFALRATNPMALYGHADPVGPNNNNYIVESARKSNMVICAWGNHGNYHGRADVVRSLLSGCGIPLHYLKMNGDGQPSHPLYLPETLLPQLWMVP